MSFFEWAVLGALAMIVLLLYAIYSQGEDSRLHLSKLAGMVSQWFDRQ